jgi:hypothetical protein
VITGPSIVKFVVVLLATPPTVTLIGPADTVAVAGTVVVIEPSDQTVGVAVHPLTVTELVPCVVPNPLPLIWICAPGRPLVGFTPVTETPPTVYVLPVLLLVLPTVTFTPPVVAPVGTVATI